MTMDETRKIHKETMSRLDQLQPLSGIAATRVPGERDALPDPAAELAPELAPFKDAGWHFVVPGPGASPGSQRKLFRDGDGHVKIDGGALNLRFDPEAAPQEIERLLINYGLSIRRQLGFAPNLFLVAPDAWTEGDDTVTLARALTREPIIVYAEPILIEELDQR